MNRLFCWLLLAAILVEKGEWKFGLDDFGLWVILPPIAPKYGVCTRVGFVYKHLILFMCKHLVPVHADIYIFVVGTCFGFETADLLFLWSEMNTRLRMDTIVELFFLVICYVIIFIV